MFKMKTKKIIEGEEMTITQTSEKYGLTKNTLRYYEKIGLISKVPRNKSGIRDYDERTCQRIEFIKCMRSAGVEIEKLIEYIEMIEKGPGTVKARKELLEEQRIKLIEKQKGITRNNRKTEL